MLRDDDASRAGAKARRVEELASLVVDTGLRIHRELGPGLLETAYEAVLAASLTRSGVAVQRQVAVPIEWDGVTLNEGFRLDLLIDDLLIVELKSVEKLNPVHCKQVLTYLRLMDLPLGLLINFGAELFKHGVKRIVNNHTATTGSNLRIHQ